MNFLKGISQRLIFVYVLLLCLFFGVFQGRAIVEKVQRQTLNRLKPESFRALKERMEKQIPISTKNLDEYIFYYQKVAHYIRPISDDVYGILGYCYYLSGHTEQSRRYFEKARAVNSNYFWYPYNLGILALEAKDYKKASAYFEQARTMNKDKTTLTTATSLQIYMPLTFSHDQDLIFWLAQRLDQATQKNNLLFLYAYEKLEPSRKLGERQANWPEIRRMIESSSTVDKLQVF